MTFFQNVSLYLKINPLVGHTSLKSKIESIIDPTAAARNVSPWDKLMEDLHSLPIDNLDDPEQSNRLFDAYV